MTPPMVVTMAFQQKNTNEKKLQVYSIPLGGDSAPNVIAVSPRKGLDRKKRPVD